MLHVLRWLLQRVFGKRLAGNTYSPTEKTIYAYFNGAVLVKVDPLELYKRIVEIGPELWTDIRVSRSISQDAPTAHVALVGKVRGFFNLASLEEGGLTDTEALGLFNDFMSSCELHRQRFEEIVDIIEQHGGFGHYFSKRPTYFEHFGLWLNRKRVAYRRAGSVALGVGVAMGHLDPGLEFYRAITDGEGEAIALKGVYESLRRSKSDG